MTDLKLPAIQDPGGTIEQHTVVLQQIQTLLQQAGLSGATALPWDPSVEVKLPGVHGFVPSNNVNDPTNDLDFTEGWIVDTDGFGWHQPALVSCRGDAAWAFRQNAGKLENGATDADGSWHWHAMWSDKRGVGDVLKSASATNPVLPGDFSRAVRIFSLPKLSGANVLFTATGIEGGAALEVLLKTPVRNFGSTNPGTSAVTWTTSAPIGVKMRAIVDFLLYSSGGAALTVNGLLRSPDQTDTAPSSSLRNIFLESTGTPTFFNGPGATLRGIMRTDASATLRYRLDASSSNVNVDGVSNGWIDDRVV